jgi:predicted phage gp36 major capsid-like protein
VVTKIRKFKDTTGQYIWQPSLRARHARDAARLPADPRRGHAGAGQRLEVAGVRRLPQAYQIVDRQGMRVLRDPYTAKPYVKFYTTKRTGGGVVNFEAIKLLSFG